MAEGLGNNFAFMQLNNSASQCCSYVRGTHAHSTGVQHHFVHLTYAIYRRIWRIQPQLEFCHLQAYIKNLAPALTAPRQDRPARGFTRQMAKELGHLVECVKLVNMDCFHAMVEGKMHPAMARKTKMDEAFYDQLTVGLWFLHQTLACM